MKRHLRVRPAQQGQTMTEYLIILPLLLLLVLGVIQFALIYQAKTSLNYATFMGARQGAMVNARKSAIQHGLASAMAPYFMRTLSAPSLEDLAKARVIAAIEVFNTSTTQVDILSPTPAAFKGFSEQSGEASIPNDNLMYRDSAPVFDGMSIQDANLLKIRVTYCLKLVVPLVVPLVDRVIYSLSRGVAGVKNLSRVSYEPGGTPTVKRSCPDADVPPGGSKRTIDSLDDIGKALASSDLDEALGGVQRSFPTIPLLAWTLDGMRIPITSEAIVRMQSPVTF